MHIGLYCKQTSTELHQIINELFQHLKNADAKIWIHPESNEIILKYLENEEVYSEQFIKTTDIPQELDYLLTIGGDGTFLSGFSAINYQNIPLLGINTGRLGFLADVSPNQIGSAIECLKDNKFTIEQRSLLECKTSGVNQQFPLALNEIVVHKQDSSSMIIIHTYVDNDFLASYMADGLIIATPTGSTAYSMSAGGPIISPDTNAFIITPIAPHNLTARPLVIPDNQKLTLKIECRDEKYRLALDSNSFVIDKKSELEIYKATNHTSIIKLDNQNFYKTIRNKLMWGVDNRF